jgi:uncharacterized RDD family membrane protein YckC
MKKVVKIVPLWKRVVAYIVDSMLIGVIIVKPLMLSNSEESFSGFVNMLMSKDFWVASCLIVLLTWVYWIYLDWVYGQSVGKILFKLRVVDENGKELNFFQALVRNVSKLSFVVLFFDVLFMIFGSGDQRLFEKASKTRVVEVVENE